MNEVEKQVSEQLSKLVKNYKNKKYLLAVSGGSDSTCLTHIFNHLGLNFATAHCNFKLRNEESDEDEAFILNLCQSLGVKCFNISFNTKKIANINKRSIQEEARALRYDWFKQLKKENNFDFIVTAHHEDDKIETFFINQIRGSGIRGLASIPENKNGILRPLLVVSKKSINNYLVNNNIAYRNDSSNNSLKYSRNYLRHKIIPNLDNVHPNAKKGIVKTIENIAETNGYLQQKLEEDKAKIIETENNAIKININENTSSFLIYNIVNEYGFNKTNVNNLLEIKQKGKYVANSKFRMTIENKQILIYPKKEDENIEEYLITTECIVSTPIFLNISKAKGKVDFQSNTAYFDANKVNFPLKLRKWKKGDKFIPLGMKGMKKVSDYFIDTKLNQFEKENCWILENDNKICWIVGYRQDERSKITKETINYIKIVTK